MTISHNIRLVGKLIEILDSRDWTQIFECLDTIKSELKEFFPYKYIEIEAAEADDIIGVLAKSTGTNR